MEEIWKDIKGYENKYQVSNLGRVKSLTFHKSRSEKILKLSPNTKGYLQIGLTKDSIRKVLPVHMLVMTTFTNFIPNGMRQVIDHINENKTDNRLENLRILSHRENILRGMKEKTSEYPGVSWKKQTGKWVAQILINGSRKYLGSFANEIEAAEAYQKELNKY